MVRLRRGRVRGIALVRRLTTLRGRRLSALVRRGRVWLVALVRWFTSLVVRRLSALGGRVWLVALVVRRAAFVERRRALGRRRVRPTAFGRGRHVSVALDMRWALGGRRSSSDRGRRRRAVLEVGVPTLGDIELGRTMRMGDGASSEHKSERDEGGVRRRESDHDESSRGERWELWRRLVGWLAGWY
ncbi:hypothetical protein DFH11DRAFT_1056703 [Phellopilus nigrolimitatus]|nr:hypothetical protein DFH11DRAFT_1056703 [Phellopilus nigrolimitatus]